MIWEDLIKGVAKKKCCKNKFEPDNGNILRGYVKNSRILIHIALSCNFFKKMALCKKDQEEPHQQIYCLSTTRVDSEDSVVNVTRWKDDREQDPQSVCIELQSSRKDRLEVNHYTSK